MSSINNIKLLTGLVISSMADLAIEQVLVKYVGLTAMIGVHDVFNFVVHFGHNISKQELQGGLHCSMPAVCLLFEEFVFLA